MPVAVLRIVPGPFHFIHSAAEGRGLRERRTEPQIFVYFPAFNKMKIQYTMLVRHKGKNSNSVLRAVLF